MVCGVFFGGKRCTGGLGRAILDGNLSEGSFWHAILDLQDRGRGQTKKQVDGRKETFILAETDKDRDYHTCSNFSNVSDLMSRWLFA